MFSCQFAEQRMRQAVSMLGDGFQGFALSRCAGQAWIVRAGAFGQAPVALLARLGRLALAQQGWQCPAEGVAQAVLVVLRGPQAELEQRRGQRWFRVQQFQRRLELFHRYFALVAQLDQNADNLASTEGHAQAHAWLQRGARHASRRQIIEQAAQGRGQRQAEDAGRQAVFLGKERRW